LNEHVRDEHNDAGQDYLVNVKGNGKECKRNQDGRCKDVPGVRTSIEQDEAEQDESKGSKEKENEKNYVADGDCPFLELFSVLLRLPCRFLVVSLNHAHNVSGVLIVHVKHETFQDGVHEDGNVDQIVKHFVGVLRVRKKVTENVEREGCADKVDNDRFKVNRRVVLR
jgi:hypothetical protein